MGPLLSFPARKSADKETLLRITARHESTRGSNAEKRAMNSGVSVTGNKNYNGHRLSI